jgi:hypothetical protein
MATQANVKTHTPGPWMRSGVRQKINFSDSHSILATVAGKEISIAAVWYGQPGKPCFRERAQPQGRNTNG